VPGPFPFPGTISLANPERPVCYAQFFEQMEVYCLPANNQ
jgi:hypothetical protein